MEQMLRRAAVAVLGLGLVGLMGCTKSEPSRFYVLDPGAGLEAAETGTSTRQGVAVGVGPVEIPQYLDRPQIVTRVSANSLDLGEFDQWAGRLSEDVSRVLAEQLSDLLATDNVSVFPWSGSARVDYQVTVKVLAFEADGAGTSSLDARWEITEASSRQTLVTARSRLRQGSPPATEKPRTPAEYQAIVASMSDNLAALARDIAERIAAF
jgi:uncharacterized lipoprotein YmbA